MGPRYGVNTFLAPLCECDRGDGATSAQEGTARREAFGIDAAGRPPVFVLVADDHPANRELLIVQLAALGHASEAACDGKSALELWRTDRFALLLTDCKMPRMDGFQLASAIRAAASELSGTVRKPIIALTANADATVRDQCLAAGMDDILVKPIELPVLARCLARWLPPGEQAVSEAVPAAATETQSFTGLPSALTSADEPIDLTVLYDLMGGDSSAQARIIGRFREANDEDLQLLARAVSAGDFEQMARAAHRIKGTAGAIVAVCLAKAAADLEIAARDSALDVCARVYVRVVSATAIDLIISDVDMPHMDGLELIRHLHSLGYDAALAVLSALDSRLLKSVESMTREHGLALIGVIEKPPTRDRLQNIFARYASYVHERAGERAPVRPAAPPIGSMSGIDERRKRSMRIMGAWFSTQTSAIAPWSPTIPGSTADSSWAWRRHAATAGRCAPHETLPSVGPWTASTPGCARSPNRRRSRIPTPPSSKR